MSGAERSRRGSYRRTNRSGTRREGDGWRGRLLEQVLEAVHGFPRPGRCARDGEATRVPSRRNISRDEKEPSRAEPSSQWQRWTTERGRGGGTTGTRGAGRRGEERRGVGGASAWRGPGLLSPCRAAPRGRGPRPRRVPRCGVGRRGRGAENGLWTAPTRVPGPVTWAVVVLLWLNRVGPPWFIAF